MNKQLFSDTYYRLDLRIEEIAQRLGISMYSLARTARELGLPTRRESGVYYRPVLLKIDEIKKRRQNGETLREIAKAYRCSPSVVGDICKQHNIVKKRNLDNFRSCDVFCYWYETCKSENLWTTGTPCEGFQLLEENPNLYELTTERPNGHGMKAHFARQK